MGRKHQGRGHSSAPGQPLPPASPGTPIPPSGAPSSLWVLPVPPGPPCHFRSPWISLGPSISLGCPQTLWVPHVPMGVPHHVVHDPWVPPISPWVPQDPMHPSRSPMFSWDPPRSPHVPCLLMDHPIPLLFPPDPMGVPPQTLQIPPDPMGPSRPYGCPPRPSRSPQTLIFPPPPMGAELGGGCGRMLGGHPNTGVPHTGWEAASVGARGGPGGGCSALLRALGESPPSPPGPAAGWSPRVLARHGRRTHTRWGRRYFGASDRKRNIRGLERGGGGTRDRGDTVAATAKRGGGAWGHPRCPPAGGLPWGTGTLGRGT